MGFEGGMKDGLEKMLLWILALAILLAVVAHVWGQPRFG
jgi:hypothetical protein